MAKQQPDTFFKHHGDVILIQDQDSAPTTPQLPPDTFAVGIHPDHGFILTRTENLVGGEDLFGNVMDRVDRIFDTYHDRADISTGILLDGEKGSGKTLLAKKLAEVGRTKYGMPTLLINAAFTGDAFNKLMQRIDQDCVVLFDEFEKTYDAQDQESLLTLFDGVYRTHKLFVLTANDRSRIEKHFFNRPGRIFYQLTYDGLGLDVVQQYCEKYLKNKLHLSSILNAASLYSKFNFDILKALVEEINRYDCTVREALQWLNAKPDGTNNYYKIELKIDGVQVPANQLEESIYRGNPFFQSNLSVGHKVLNDEGLKVQAKNPKDVLWHLHDEGRHWYTEEIVFTQNELVSMDALAGTYSYKATFNRDDEGNALEKPFEAELLLTREIADRVDPYANL